VETVARSVDERVRGDQILDVWFSSHTQPFKTPPEVLASGLLGRVFLAVHRSGKHIVCELGPVQAALRNHSTFLTSASKNLQPIEAQDPAPEAQWIVHLGMTGRLLVTAPADPVAPHTHARLTLKSGREIRFVDPRRFGRLEFRDFRRSASFAAPGAEPLTIAQADFDALFLNRRLAIKAALLNQSLLAGVGNIYADESLFRAAILPQRSAGRLKKDDLARLRTSLRNVLIQAIKRGGSSVSDYVDANGARGFFQLEHRVYQRTGEPCLVCKTLIRRIVIAGRSTHFCPHCQR
jgi:formamidopyrimidine-DNA glycosylase